MFCQKEKEALRFGIAECIEVNVLFKKVKSIAYVENYALVARKNPLKKEDPAKFYPQIQHSGEVTLDEISDDIEENCTATSSDIQAVVVAIR